MSKTVKIQSWFEMFKQKATEFFDSLDLSYEAAKKMGIYAGIGFGIGFVLKKFGTLIVLALILTGVVLYSLSNTQFIAIDSEKLKLFLGITHNASVSDVIDLYWTWITNHLPLSISFCVGFFFGYKLG